MGDELVEMLREAIAEADYRLGDTSEERSFLAESAERVVWSAIFPTAVDLRLSWHAVQAEAVEKTQSLSAEKAWELYLVLATELTPDADEESDLELIRHDVSYARKVLVPGLEDLAPRQLAEYLSPLLPLEVDAAKDEPDALSRLNDLISEQGDEDVVTVVRAFEENRPLFGEF